MTEQKEISGGNGNQSRLPHVGLLVTGLVLIAIPLFFVVLFPAAYDAAQFYLRLCASLGGGLIGAFIPGVIDIETSWAKAGGAMGVFFLVFTFEPSWDVYNAVESNISRRSDANSQSPNQIPDPTMSEAPILVANETHSLEPSISVNTETIDQEALDRKIAACVLRAVQDYQRPKEKSVIGGARAPGPGPSTSRKTDTKDICLSVGPEQEIIDARTENVTRSGGRCSVTAPKYSADRREVCVKAKAWSDSSLFGGGGKAEYKLTAQYRHLANEDQVSDFRLACESAI